LAAREKHYPDLLRDLAGEFSAVFKARGLDAMQADVLAQAAVERLRRLHGGAELYIPNGRHFDARLEHLDLFQRWQAGANPRDLARSYGVTLAWTYRLIAKLRARQPNTGSNKKRGVHVTVS
jgi:Mor family transcriptional regulator